MKRFITSAESDDLFENIVHQVLARPVGAAAGTKGLSLFLVPKFHFDPQTGVPGERNGVYVTNLEHKMGLKASATCELTFGEHGTPAVGYLLGEMHDGIAQMFHVIEDARMMVGTKAIATLSSGYLNALDYAKTRVQGTDLTRMADKAAPKVTITRHPDVRRSLMLQKAYAEGLRAVYLYTAAHQDAVAAQQVAGIEDPDLARRVNDLLLPIVKGVGSVQDMVAKLTQYLLAAQDEPSELYKIGLVSVRFLLAFGDLLIGWRLLVAAETALTAIDSNPSDQDRALLPGQDRRGVALREDGPAPAQHRPGR